MRWTEEEERINLGGQEFASPPHRGVQATDADKGHIELSWHTSFLTHCRPLLTCDPQLT